ncbi:MAG: polysaccharide biosynthesis C-terminal domain-containing protein, partial [Actinobacteria bacterium]|nr:polysaccharide biosynthesis C-terminal domain-containing protein [Actinomycetota bacterium]
MALGEVLDDVGGETLVLYFSGGHYRQPIAFSDERLEDAARAAATRRRLLADGGLAARPVCRECLLGGDTVTISRAGHRGLSGLLGLLLLLGLLALPAAVGTVLLAQPLVSLLVGSGYEEAVTPLRILSVAVLFSFVNPLFTNILVAADLQRRMLWATLVAIVVNVGLNLVLIPAYTYNGAAAATVASEAVAVTIVAVWAVRHTRARLDWGAVEPAIFGTLFERSLDPAQRARLGAHYTSREDILKVVGPVLIAPLRREWEEVRSQAEEEAEKARTLSGTKAANALRRAES